MFQASIWVLKDIAENGVSKPWIYLSWNRSLAACGTQWTRKRKWVQTRNHLTFSASLVDRDNQYFHLDPSFLLFPSAIPLFSSYSCKSPVLISLLSISGPHHGLLLLLLHLLCASSPSHSVKTDPRFPADNVLYFWAFLGCSLCIRNISVFSGLLMPITSKMICSGC